MFSSDKGKSNTGRVHTKTVHNKLILPTRKGGKTEKAELEIERYRFLYVLALQKKIAKTLIFSPDLPTIVV